MPSREIIAATVAAVRSIAAARAVPLRILDLSCGDGHLLAELARDGHRVEGTHFRPDDYIYKNPASIVREAKIHDGVDLTQRLPLPDAEYDVVIATEVLEHLPSHVSICSEVRRIVKPGGCFVFSTPNIHRLHSRVQFLLSGQHELRSARLTWDIPSERLYTTHHNPVYFPSFHTILFQQGFRIERLVFTEMKPWALLLALLYPIVCAATLIETRHAMKRSRAGGRDLRRWMMDYRMLFSDQLLAVTKKGAVESCTP